jgi:hypothetical protein
MAQTAGWVAEFDQFTPVGPVDLTGGVAGPEHDIASLQSMGSKGKPSAAEGGSTSTVEELQAEMKLLNWHKLANEAALKVSENWRIFFYLFPGAVLRSAERRRETKREKKKKGMNAHQNLRGHDLFNFFSPSPFSHP